MISIIDHLSSINLLSALIVSVLVFSVIQGAKRGASGSVRQLTLFVMEGLMTIASVVVSWKLMEWLSPVLRDWLISKQIMIPNEKLGVVRQFYYTIVTGVRDFSLMRSGLIFLLVYIVCKHVLMWALHQFPWTHPSSAPRTPKGFRSWMSSLVGGGIGILTGAGRALMIIAVLFVATMMFPKAPMTEYIQQSSIYQKGASEIIHPVTGSFLQEQLPVFTRAVEAEFNSILQRKYEVLDANVPDNVIAAAQEVTAGAETDEEKARALYEWVGTRVRYDHEKVRLYEEERIWKEQTPEDTFASREGVCIDYSRLYAVMARSVGLEVKVVTGLGYDGRGSYGPHAWNEVYLAEQGEWVPLDPTWVSSGGDWFNPPNFYETHVKDA
ncbi:transglutaminase domain-containing protein [Paenibacillus sp. J2TS4]|uniref:transglutaminase domain-containing protein n=1 Tax=Paenibacillus sp. J2TS4 TaxID=2807194 RepID=UPI001B14F6DE|nr:transglutaminase domain-containing protein [Paenibacillus sp. J2TS4]GIP31155.1 hypothetical protein J2TS4_03650 [Paenibacillus sp. J2TS4]